MLSCTSCCLEACTILVHLLIASVVQYNLQPPLLIEAQQVSEEYRAGPAIAFLCLDLCIFMPVGIQRVHTLSWDGTLSASYAIDCFPAMLLTRKAGAPRSAITLTKGGQ